MFITLKIAIIAVVVSIAAVGITIGIVFAVAPLTNEDILCRSVGDISNLETFYVLGAVLITWTHSQYEHCSLEYQVNIHNDDDEGDLVVSVTVSEQHYIFENPEQCAIYTVMVYGIITTTNQRTNTLSDNISIGSDEDCEASGSGDGIVTNLEDNDSSKAYKNIEVI